MKKGKFIVIEGTDGSGKKTQKNLLVKRLQSENIPVRGISFPCYGTPTGDIIGDIYLGKELRLQNGRWFGDPDKVNPKVASLYYAADRLVHVSLITENLEKGIHVISDRYVESNMGHQGGKIVDPQERKNLVDWIENLEYNFLQLPKPDKIIFLYIPYQTSLELMDKRNEKLDGHENESHLKNAEACYLELCERYSWKKILCTYGMNVRTKEEIHDEVWRYIQEIL